MHTGCSRELPGRAGGRSSLHAAICKPQLRAALCSTRLPKQSYATFAWRSKFPVSCKNSGELKFLSE